MQRQLQNPNASSRRHNLVIQPSASCICKSLLEQYGTSMAQFSWQEPVPVLTGRPAAHEDMQHGQATSGQEQGLPKAGRFL